MFVRVWVWGGFKSKDITVSLFAIKAFFHPDKKGNWYLHLLYVQIVMLAELNLKATHVSF